MKHFTVLTAIVGLFAVEGCEDKPITYNDLDTPFHTDSLTIQTITGHTYSTPPSMGGYHKLYLGNYEDANTGEVYQNPLALFTINRYSGSIAMESLLDSNISIDSVKFKITSADTERVTDFPYSLYYFPNSEDSLFNEYETDYLDDIETLVLNAKQDVSNASILEISDTIFDETDTTNTIYTTSNVFSLNFDIPIDIFETFADTVSTSSKNRAFMVMPPEELLGLSEFYSKESSNDPRFTVYYKESDNDTTISKSNSFVINRDLSLMIPPPIIETDSTMWTVGRAKGLQSIIQVNLDTLVLMDFPSQAIIKAAKLVLFDVDDQDIDFDVLLYTLADSIVTYELEHDEDPYLHFGSSAYTLNPNVVDGKLTLDLKTILQDIIMGRIENYGFKIVSGATNPFAVMHFGSPNGSLTDPYLEVRYVSE